MKQNNYETMRDQARAYFLDFDQDEMIRKFDLQYDEKYLYICFCSRPYRIGRKTGIVEWSEDQFQTFTVGDYNECMTIYDILCYSKQDRSLSGEYAPSSSLKGIVYTGMNAGCSTGSSETARFFDAYVVQLEQACIILGGIPEGKGDLAFRIPIFDFLPVRFSFWRADEDFPAEVRILWDTNVLSFIHFETLFYAAGHLLKRIEEQIRRANAEK